MGWEILIKKENSADYEKKLAEISDVLSKVTSELSSNNIGLMGGKTGIAIFFFYYSRFTNQEKYADIAADLISSVFDDINNGFTFHTFASGLAGIGWTIEHLAKNSFIDVDTDEILSDLDSYLHQTMMAEIRNGHYDYLHGALGVGLYFLNHLSSPNAKEYLVEMIDHLETISEKDDDGTLKWKSVLDMESQLTGNNLSLSHGISSIIAFLSKALDAGIHEEKVKYLLNGAVGYLLKHKLDRSKFTSNFPSWVTEKDPLTASRLAWCYGDLGNGMALFQAAQSTKNKEWEKIAIDVLLDSTSRKDLKENSVIDPGLCHGSIGMMHIYNRIYQETGIGAFKESALYWAEQGLKMDKYEDGYAGYKVWHTEKHGGWVNEAGLLEGISGIGLGFISMLSEIDSKWDASLLLS